MVSQKTIERLIVYRSLLEKLITEHEEYVYSKALATLTGNTAAQVRRDLMSIGFSGNPKYGYDVKGLCQQIKTFLEPKDGIAMALIGVGNLGRAILGYFSTMRPTFRLVAAFDTDENKIGRVISGCRCHHLRDLPNVLTKTPADLGVITVPGSNAQRVADMLIENGVPGLVNFSPEPIKVPTTVHLETINMTLLFEKAAYFTNATEKGETP